MGGRVFLLKASCFFLTVFFFAPQFAFSQQTGGGGKSGPAIKGPAVKKNSHKGTMGPFPYEEEIVEVDDVKVLPTTFALNDLADTASLLLIETDTANMQYLPRAIIIPDMPIVASFNSTKLSSEMKEAMSDLETDLLINKFAEMIEMSADDIENFPLYRFIDNWYGVRYKYGGNDNKGIDCSGFSKKLYGSIYSVDILRTARQQHKSCEIIRHYGDATEGDLIFFRIHRLRISHVGIYLANGYFVHASRSRGVMISSLDDKYWRRRYAGCGRIEREEAASESGFLQ